MEPSAHMCRRGATPGAGGAHLPENSRGGDETEAFCEVELAVKGSGEAMKADQAEQLFVYGTLMPGYGNHHRIAEHVHSARPGTIQGVLVDLGAFPALVPGRGMVRGVLLAVDAEALQVTDHIEGCHLDRSRSLYIRESIEVALDGGEAVRAWTYFFAHPLDVPDYSSLQVGRAGDIPTYAWPAR